MKNPRVWPVFVAFGVALLAVLITSTTVAVLQSRSTGHTLGEVPFDLQGLITGAVVTQTVLLLTTLAFARPLRAARLRLGPAPGGGRTYLVVVLGTLALAQLVDSAARLTGVYRSSALAQIEYALAGTSGTQLLLALLLIGPMAGFVEELFFRGLLQTRLAERWRPWAAVAITSVLFALVHFDPVHSSGAFVLGLWLGGVTQRAGSIRPAIAGHVVNNSVATILAAVGLTSPGVGVNLALGLVALVVFVMCARHVMRGLPAPAHPPEDAAPDHASDRDRDDPDPLRIATRTGVL